MLGAQHRMNLGKPNGHEGFLICIFICRTVKKQRTHPPGRVSSFEQGTLAKKPHTNSCVHLFQYKHTCSSAAAAAEELHWAAVCMLEVLSSALLLPLQTNKKNKKRKEHLLMHNLKKKKNKPAEEGLLKSVRSSGDCSLAASVLMALMLGFIRGDGFYVMIACAD